MAKIQSALLSLLVFKITEPWWNATFQSPRHCTAPSVVWRPITLPCLKWEPSWSTSRSTRLPCTAWWSASPINSQSRSLTSFASPLAGQLLFLTPSCLPPTVPISSYLTPLPICSHFQCTTEQRRHPHPAACWQDAQHPPDPRGGQWVPPASRGSGEEAHCAEVQCHDGWHHNRRSSPALPEGRVQDGSDEESRHDRLVCVGIKSGCFHAHTGLVHTYTGLFEKIAFSMHFGFSSTHKLSFWSLKTDLLQNFQDEAISKLFIVDV